MSDDYERLPERPVETLKDHRLQIVDRAIRAVQTAPDTTPVHSTVDEQIGQVVNAHFAPHPTEDEINGYQKAA